MSAADNTEIRGEQAAQIANRMVADAFEQGARGYFYVTVPNVLPCHWTDGCETGVTFTRAERAAALDWVTLALIAGQTVFHRPSRRGWGSGDRLDDGDNRDTRRGDRLDENNGDNRRGDDHLK